MPTHPGWKLWGLTIITVIIGVIVSIGASVKIADGNTRDALRGQCQQLAVTIQAYAETPPTTTTGRNVRQSTIDYYESLGCPEKLS